MINMKCGTEVEVGMNSVAVVEIGGKGKAGNGSVLIFHGEFYRTIMNQKYSYTKLVHYTVAGSDPKYPPMADTWYSLVIVDGSHASLQKV